MSNSGETVAEWYDRNSPDHSPECPRCGNLCAQVDKWSPCCGVWLRARGPSATEVRLHAMLNAAAQSREDISPREGMEA